MIKFSTISGQKVNSEPKNEESKIQLELNGFKSMIIDLMDKTLTVRNTGSYKHAMISTQIDGKEMFLEALLDFLSEKENTKSIDYLESLKKTNKDWKSIDEKISEIITENCKIKFLNDNSAHLEKIISFLDKYSLSEDFDDILENQILKIEDYNTALLRSEVAEKMLENEKYSKYPKGRLRNIVLKFSGRAKQLLNNETK